MITPAKWQTAEADQKIASEHSYGEFREKLVPHMREVVFYPDCKDVFSIMQSDGITYFSVDKQNIIDKCNVVNRCKAVREFNSTVKRDIKNRETLINIGDEINRFFSDAAKFKFPYMCGSHRYLVCTNAQLPGGGLYAISKNNPKVYYLGLSEVYDTLAPR